jgi:hypothetical protein
MLGAAPRTRNAPRPRPADEVGRLVLRAYEQARTAPQRSAVLDLIDKLLLFAAYRVDELVDAAER